MMFHSWLMWPLLVIVIVTMLSSAWVAFNKRAGRVERFMSLLTLLAFVYGLGVALKFMVIGPDFVRWHLADIGFPMAIIGMWARFRSARARRRHPEWDHAYARQSLVEATSARLAAPVVVFMSYGYELSTAWIPRSSAAPVGVGGFDWVDIACYTAGGVLVSVVSRRHVEYIGRILRTYDDSVAHLAALEARKFKLEAAGARTVPPRRANKKKSKSKRKRR